MRSSLLSRSAASGLLLAAACARTSTVAPVPSTPVVAVPNNAPLTLADARQLVLVTTSSWDATSGMLRRFERASANDAWTAASGAIPVVIGRTGLAWGDANLASAMSDPVKHEGDGKSPAGAFPLDTAFGFAPRTEQSALRLPYAPLTSGSECVDDQHSTYYNTIVDRSAVPRVDWTSAERMRQIDQYRIGVVVGYNAQPPVRGRGSCIFLHIWAGPQSTTAGCTALDAGALETLVRWLDASRKPALVQLVQRDYERLRTSWSLPAL